MATTAFSVAWNRSSTSIGVLVMLLCFTGAADGQSVQPPSDQVPGPIVRVGANQLESYIWDFSRFNDRDFNEWPDGWDRLKGRRYPQYVDITIESHDEKLAEVAGNTDAAVMKLWQRLRTSYTSLPPLPPSIRDVVDDRYLRVTLNGGLAMVQSSPIPSNQLFQYRFSCRIKTQGLRRDTASAELLFLSATGQVLAIHQTPPVGGSRDWTELTLEQIRPPQNAVKMIARLRVDGDEDGGEDVNGSIGFDDVKIEQFPQLLVETDEKFGLYDVGASVTATAKVLGLPVEGPKVRFRLYDVVGNEIGTDMQAIVVPATTTGVTATETASYSVLNWRLPRLQPGFYRVTAELVNTDGQNLATETTFAILDDLEAGSLGGRFGWTLPEGLKAESREFLPEPRKLTPWLNKLAVRWVKYPCWIAPDDSTSAEETAILFSRMQESGIQTVGLLDIPPEDVQSQFNLRGSADAVAANLFGDYSIWQPALEPIMTRLTLKVRQWQLGSDTDTSFLGHPRLSDQVETIADGLQGFGQELDIALTWPWAEPLVPNDQATWHITNRTMDPPLTASELDAHLKHEQTQSAANKQRIWLVLNPIDAQKYSQEDRVIDLVQRMAAVQSNHVEAAFVSDPRNENTGVLRPNGRPGAMLLPWRTTSSLIGNLSNIGTLNLRSGASNIVFANDNRVVLMVWSPTDCEEELYLGQDVSEIDVWGQKTRLATEFDEWSDPVQRFKIGRVPKFIVGIDPTLMLFRMSFKLETPELDSLLEKPQELKLRFSNPTGENLSGEITIHELPHWRITERSHGWEMGPGRSTEDEFAVILGNNATIGEYELPITFDLQREVPQRITVYPKIRVGPAGLALNARTSYRGNGDLVVQVEMKNSGARDMAFDCSLYPGHQRQHETRFLSVPAESTNSALFIVRNARGEIGTEILLKANELDGERVLNYPITIEH